MSHKLPPIPPDVPQEVGMARQLDWHLLDDSDLIHACLGGVEQAWAELLERYSGLIYSIPLRCGFPKGVADEIFQETCLILLEKLGSIQQHERLNSWLMTVTRRACIRRMRQPQEGELTERIEAMTPAGEASLEQQLIELEQTHKVQLALQKLSPTCQQLIQALFLQEPPLTYEEITEQLGLPLGSIGPNRSRCLQKFRQALEELEN